MVAESQGLGEGSTFTVRLPLAALAAPETVAESTVASGRKTVRVLVVDDNVASAQIMGWMLELMSQVHDGLEVLSAVDGFRPDVILLDIGLPGMKGYEVCRSLRAKPEYAGIRMIAQTGWGQDKDVQAARDAGFDVHLVKSVGIDALETALVR